MKKLLSVLCAVTVFPSIAHASGSVEGYWLTQNERSVIHLAPCGESMCGKIHWIIDGGLQYDEKNPDETLRKRPMCGLQIMWGFEPDDEDEMDEWEDGKIYKADEGDIYDADIELNDDGTLKLRGYIGVSLFGKSQVWTRVDPKNYKKCKAAN